MNMICNVWLGLAAIWFAANSFLYILNKKRVEYNITPRFKLLKERRIDILINLFSKKRRRLRNTTINILKMFEQNNIDILTLPKNIDLVISNNIAKQKSGGASFAFFRNKSEYGILRIDPYQYDPDNVNSILNIPLSLAHELIHAEQVVLKKMMNMGHGIVEWNDGNITSKFTGDISLDSKDYKNYPWEKEAYARQEEVMYKLLGDYINKEKD